MTTLADQFEALAKAATQGGEFYAEGWTVWNTNGEIAQCDSDTDAEFIALCYANRTAISSALTSAKRLAYRESARDWTEDYPHENGQYLNHCHFCGALFCGHKRRVQCKVCAHPAATTASAPPVQEGWRAIETAPEKHGARFMTWSPDVGHVVCERYQGQIVLAWDQRPYMSGTHWQPLYPPELG